jgi:hypothetical protein
MQLDKGTPRVSCDSAISAKLNAEESEAHVPQLQLCTLRFSMDLPLRA